MVIMKQPISLAQRLERGEKASLGMTEKKKKNPTSSLLIKGGLEKVPCTTHQSANCCFYTLAFSKENRFYAKSS